MVDTNTVVDTDTDIDITIDAREEKLITALESTYLKKECDHMMFDTAQLDVGDVIYKRGSQLVCLIERKTIDDYVASITDGRSKNQSIRIAQLKREQPQLLVIYLIEGAFISKDHHFRCGVTRDALYSSIVNRVIRDQFTIYRTADINDTALVVTKIYDKLRGCPGETSGVSPQLEYLKTIKLAKKDNMDPFNCYLCQLAQIPGVSLEMAQIVAARYGSMAQLIRALEVPETVRLLENLVMPLVNGKSRRLGPVVSKRICEYLLGELQSSPAHLVEIKEAPATQKIKITLKSAK